MREGCPRWILVLFGMIAFPLGLFLWNGLGPHFGLGKAGGTVDRRVAVVVFGATVTAIILEFVFYAG